jgi:general secretion pathway protein G
MRNAIDQCHVELGIPPRSLQQLVDAGCLREIPFDPITERREWEETITDLRGQFDITILVDVHSTSRHVSSEGNYYNEW